MQHCHHNGDVLTFCFSQIRRNSMYTEFDNMANMMMWMLCLFMLSMNGGTIHCPSFDSVDVVIVFVSL